MKLKKYLLVVIMAFALCVSASCKPSHSRVYTVGDTSEVLSNDGAKIGTIKLDSVDYSLNKDNNTCNVGLTYIIYPETTMYLDSQDIFVLCKAEKYFTDTQKNIVKNGRDIFNLSIEEEIIYTFYFVIPNSPYFDNLENREEGYLGWGITCYIENAVFEIYTGIILDDQQKKNVTKKTT